MKIYPWDENTGESLPPVEKPDNHPNPIGWCETNVQTPTDIPAGHAARVVLSAEGWFEAWEVIIDKRGEEYWTQDGVKHAITSLACDIPAGCIVEPPPSPFHRTHDGSAWIVDKPMLAAARRQERDGKLLSAYIPAIQQINRWIDSSEADPASLNDYKAQRSAWHAWADALCDLPDLPGWPWPGGDVPWPEQPPKPTRYTP